jgi:hypothetical protein
MTTNFIRIQRRIMTLYEMTPNWSQEEIDMAVHDIEFYLACMIEERQSGQDQEPVRRVRTYTTPTYVMIPSTIKILSKEEFESISPTMCAICMDFHCMYDTLVTDCGHTFCKQGYTDWIHSGSNRHVCPICRKVSPYLTVHGSE